MERKESKIKFVNLHAHSVQGSHFDAYGLAEEHMVAAWENGLEAHSLTDHGNMMGISPAIQQIKKMAKDGKNLKLQYGNEAYFIESIKDWQELKDSSAEKTKDSDKVQSEDDQKEFKSQLRKKRHLVILAKNEVGLRNLYKITSVSHEKPYMFYKPRVDFELLEKYSEGLIVTSACLGGVAAGCLWDFYEAPPEDAPEGTKGTFNLEASRVEMIRVFKEFQRILGDDFYGEVQWNKVPEQHILNHMVIDVCSELGIEVISAVDCHYPRKEDWKGREYYKRLGFLGRKWIPEWISKPVPENIDDMDYEIYIKNGDEVWESYLKYKEYSESPYDDDFVLRTIERTYELSQEKIEEFFPDTTVKFPQFVLKDGEDADEKLEKMAWDGLKEFGLHNNQEYIERLNHELDVIKKLKFSAYFLTTSEILEEGRKIMLVGPARGSAGGSLVSFCCKITEMDPVKYGLDFSRFLREDQTDFPDIDMDFARRDEMVSHLQKVWGKESVVAITNLTTLGVKNTIKDVCKLLEVPFQEVNSITSKMDFDVIPKAKEKHGITAGVYSPTYEEYKEFSQPLQNLIARYPKVDEIVPLIVGQIRGRGKHAGGILIGDDLTEQLPLISVKGDFQSPWIEGINGRQLEPMGYLKYDLLAISTMDMVERCIGHILREKLGREASFEEVRKFYDENLHPSVANTKDLEVWENIFHAGNFFQTFQATAENAQNFIKEAKPTSVVDFAALTSIQRPGPLMADVDKLYLDRKANPEAITYDHPIIEEVLRDTYGLLVFQEQISNLAYRLGDGITESDSQKIRKLLTKTGLGDTDKKLEEYRKKFVKGCHDKGLSYQKANKLWREMANFAKYGFNKSHAVSYSLVSYMCAWLAHYYPIQWAVSVLNSVNTEKIGQAISDCRSRGFKVREANVLTSGIEWSYELPNTIIQPLTGIKGVGEKAVEEIIANRPYTDLEDFLFNDRTDYKKVTKASLGKLALVGAMDDLKDERFVSESHFYEVINQSHKRTEKGYQKFLDSIEEFKSEFPYDWSREERIQNIKKFYCYYPFDVVLSPEFLQRMKDNNCQPISKFNPENGDKFLWFIVESVVTKATKNGREYLKITAIDNVGGRKTISHWGSVRDWMPLVDVAYYGILHFDGRFGYSFKKTKNHKSVLKLAQ